MNDYERKIRDFFSEKNDGKIAFDLVLFGLGEDGHIASLFPQSADL